MAGSAAARMRGLSVAGRGWGAEARGAGDEGAGGGGEGVEVEVGGVGVVEEEVTEAEAEDADEEATASRTEAREVWLDDGALGELDPARAGPPAPLDITDTTCTQTNDQDQPCLPYPTLCLAYHSPSVPPLP